MSPTRGSRPAIDLSDLRPRELHEQARESWGAKLRRDKRARRVEIGHLCLLFESRETVLWQIQEVLRVESRSSAAHIQREIDEYTCLVPQPGRLTATLMIQSGGAEVGARLSRQIDRGLLSLEIGAWRCPCQQLQPRDDEPAAVHYVGFSIPEPAIRAMSTAAVWLRVDSTLDHHRVALPPTTRASLIATLAEAEANQSAAFIHSNQARKSTCLSW
ncbi:hypothetical protein DB30_05701 [Enhygromyxa salina]|uniref:DUF3501 family protein n=1 Tax=Enhygromyxa salina TaxID=215803 RepID=A0A0C1ZCF6_9BACT|nr:DUF3501 family protein [Enhygromyxa salina]KIG15369.1 hypothetical protein DB30_05701 [Enhygromyxa salina]